MTNHRVLTPPITLPKGSTVGSKPSLPSHEINVGDLMEQVRRDVRRQTSNSGHDHLPDTAKAPSVAGPFANSGPHYAPVTEWKHFNLHLENAFAYSIVGSSLPELKDLGRWKRGAFRLAARCVLFLARFITKRQTQFNVSTLELLRELQTNVRSLDQVQREVAQRLHATIREEKTKLSDCQNAVQQLRTALSEQQAALAQNQSEASDHHRNWQQTQSAIHDQMDDQQSAIDELRLSLTSLQHSIPQWDVGAFQAGLSEVQGRCVKFQEDIGKVREEFGKVREESHTQFEELQQQQNQRKAAESELEQHLAEARAEADQRIEGLREKLEQLQEEGRTQTAQHMEAFREKLEQLREEGRTQLDEVRNQIAQSSAIMQEQQQRLQHQHDHVQEQKTHLNQLDSDYLAAKSRLVIQENRLGMFLEEARRRLPQPFNAEQLQTFADEDRHAKDALYLAFEDRFRGTRQDIKQRLRVYLPYLERAGLAREQSPILDIGCGRGEWLELLKEEGFTARGVDLNGVCVEQCRLRSLEVSDGDALAHLRQLPDDSLGAVSGFHIVEHLPFEVVLRLLGEVARVLKPGGLAIFESPNPENIMVGACNFYCDPTHQKPIYPPTLQFLAEQRGLVKVEILRLSQHRLEDHLTLLPTEHELSASLNPYLEMLKHWFMIGPDFAIIGRKVA